MNALDPFALGGQQENDTLLLIAEQALHECLARTQVQWDTSDPLLEPLCAEIGKIAGTIHNTPPSTLIGAVVKLRMLIHPVLGVEEDADSEVIIALQQVLDCVRQNLSQETAQSV